GRINNELVVLPTHSQLEDSDLDLVVAGTRSAITMIEGFAREMSEENMVQAIFFAHEQIRAIVDMIEELRQKAGLGPKQPPALAKPNPLVDPFRQRFYDEFRERKATTGKHDRANRIRELRERIHSEFLPADGQPAHTPEHVAAALEALEERVVRDLILEG